MSQSAASTGVGIGAPPDKVSNILIVVKKRVSICKSRLKNISLYVAVVVGCQHPILSAVSPTRNADQNFGNSEKEGKKIGRSEHGMILLSIRNAVIHTDLFWM